MPGKAATGMQANRGEPELRAPIAPLNVYVHRLGAITRVEEEAVGSYFENCWHPASASVPVAIRLLLDRLALADTAWSAFGYVGSLQRLREELESQRG